MNITPHQIIGAAILFSVFGFIFFITVKSAGFKLALMAWGIALLLNAIIIIGVQLIFS